MVAARNALNTDIKHSCYWFEDDSFGCKQDWVRRVNQPGVIMTQATKLAQPLSYQVVQHGDTCYYLKCLSTAWKQVLLRKLSGTAPDNREAPNGAPYLRLLESRPQAPETAAESLGGTRGPECGRIDSQLLYNDSEKARLHDSFPISRFVTPNKVLRWSDLSRVGKVS
ncbi:hypothetical protein DL93DRAFT_1506375 [Clavulina sp. PMI_390]|nr:hypothetical protein DL93DRAFT_1506375 [Clavulina sp. PMI_390]